MNANDLDPDDPGAPRRGDVVLVTDASAEGESIGAALRARGFVVVDVPLGLLEARVAGELPEALVVDIDEPGAYEALDRVRERPAGAAAEVVCVGDPIRAAELGIAIAFERPVDIAGLVAHLARVVQPGDSVRRRAPTHPPSSLPRRDVRERRSVPPSRREPASADGAALGELQSLAPGGLPSFPALAVGPEDADPGSDPLDLASLLRGLGDESADVAPDSLSPDLAAMLSSAEHRVAASGGSPSSSPAPVGEADVVLPNDLLVLLDEPLEADDEGTGGAVGTGAASGVGTRGGTHAPLLTGAAHGDLERIGDGEARRTRSSAPPPARAVTGAGARTDVHGAASSRADEGDPLSASAHGTATGPGTFTRTATTFEPESAGARVAELLGASPSPDRSRSTRPPAADAGESAAPAFAHAVPPPPFAHEVATSPLPPFGSARAERPVPRAPALPWPPPAISPAPPVALTPSPPTAASAAGARGSNDEPLPAVLGEGDAVRALARAIASRASGSLALGADAGPRRVVLRDGDVVTAGSGVPDETLAAFLASRGDLERDAAARLASKLPPFGRHAGAALVAHGHLGQDDLWPVLRAHAEWIIGRALAEPRSTCELEDEPPGRLKAEPSVFGGATGAEVLVETVRRVVRPDEALTRLGGGDATLEEGPRAALLGECALAPEDADAVRLAAGRTVADAMQGREPELANLLYALAALGVLEARAPERSRQAAARAADDPLDEEALPQRVRARMALVEDGDYFALLGVPRSATSYEIRRAYVELRRSFEPGRVLTAATADLADDCRLILEVLDEAYEILREPNRRDRYRRAIEAGPP